MKNIANGTPDFIQKIIDDENNLREQQKWFDSFDNISRHERLIAYYNGETDIVTIFDIIDIIYTIEVDINKTVAKVRAIKYEKWKKCFNELNIVKEATWLDEDSNIIIWEVIDGINALPFRDSD